MQQRRFLSRDEWPLIAAGLAAGLLVSAVVLYLFIQSIRGAGVPVEAVDRELGEIERLDTVTPPGAAVPGRGLIGRREGGITARLADLRVIARPLRGPLAVTLRNVEWDDPAGARFARADVVRGQLSSRALQRGDVLLENVVVQRPVITLNQGAPGTPWNFERVFAELLDAPPSPGPVRTIQVRNLQILDGTVDVTRPAQRFSFRSLQSRLPLVVLSQPGVPEPYLRVATLTTQFVQAEPEARLALDMRDGVVRFPDGTVHFDIAAATLDRTQLASIRGSWDAADPGYGVTAEGLARGVEFEDFAFMLPEAFPATGTASFAWSVRPLPGDLTEATLTELDARSGDSRALGALRVQFGEEQFALLDADLRLDPLELALVEGFTGPLPYGGRLTGRLHGVGGDITFDLTADLTAPTVVGRFAVGLSGRVLLREDEVAVQRLDVDLNRTPLAALRALAPALPVDGVVTGRITLTGLPTEAPLALDLRLELGMGVAIMQGTLDLTGAAPEYDLAGRLLGVDLQAVLAPDVPPVALTASFSVVGVGFDPATMSAAIAMAGRFTGWEAAPGDTIHLEAQLRRGELDVQTLVATLATADLTVRGRWRYMEPQSGAISYDATVTSLRPWGPYIPVIGDPLAAGAVRATGTLTGTLDRLRLAGVLAATEVQSGEWRARSVDAAYDIVVGDEPLPVMMVNATATGISTPTAGDFRDGVLQLQLVPPGLELTLTAQRSDGGTVDIAATGLVPQDGPREVVLQRAHFDLEQGEWSLVRPAVFRWVGDQLLVDELALEDAASDGRIMVAGQLWPLSELDARVQVAALPTADLQRLIGQPERLRGQLWVDATVRGTPGDPLVNLDFRIIEGAIADVPLRLLEGRIAYVDRETVIEAVAMVDTVGTLDIRARLPSVLQFDADPVFELVDGVPLEGSVRAERFGLAAVATFFPELRDVAGVMDAEVNLTGTADAPVVDGVLTLAGGAMTVVPLEQRYTDISADIGFDGRRLLLRDVRARSDGWVVIGGHVVLARLDQPVVEVDIVFDGFRPIGVENQRDAAVFGTLSIAGPPDALELTGSIRVDDGYVVIPQMGGPGADLIDITRPPPVIGQPTGSITDGGPMENLRIRDLRVTAGETAWFMAADARVQLAGTLTINKIGDSFPIVGTLDGTRGQYTLIAGPIVRRFDIVSAQVRFLGASQPNPAIDITARRIVYDPGGRELPVDVRITGTLETPRLALAGAETVDLAEAELLSLLLFGQPGFALGGDVLPGDDLLEQTFLGGLAELAAIEVERSLAGLGFDIFQIRLGHGPLGGLGTPTVVVGRQLRPDVFITVETGIVALFGGGGAGEAPPNTWAVRLDWAFDPRSRLRLAYEPVIIGRGLRGAALALPLTPPRQQLLLELRRRWTY
jgi:hypothetical protein